MTKFQNKYCDLINQPLTVEQEARVRFLVKKQLASTCRLNILCVQSPILDWIETVDLRQVNDVLPNMQWMEAFDF